MNFLSLADCQRCGSPTTGLMNVMWAFTTGRQERKLSWHQGMFFSRLCVSTIIFHYTEEGFFVLLLLAGTWDHLVQTHREIHFKASVEASTLQTETVNAGLQAGHLTLTITLQSVRLLVWCDAAGKMLYYWYYVVIFSRQQGTCVCVAWHILHLTQPNEKWSSHSITWISHGRTILKYTKQ